MTERAVHPSHDPEPDGQRLYQGGQACQQCCRFVTFEGAIHSVTDAGVAPCRPGRLSAMRTVDEVIAENCRNDPEFRQLWQARDKEDDR